MRSTLSVKRIKSDLQKHHRIKLNEREEEKLYCRLSCVDYDFTRCDEAFSLRLATLSLLFLARSKRGKCFRWLVLVLYVVLLGKATLWRVGLVRWRGVGGELRSFSDSEGSVSACGEPVSPTSSRRNLNLDRKSCHTTYQPATQQLISLVSSRCTVRNH